MFYRKSNVHIYSMDKGSLPDHAIVEKDKDISVGTVSHEPNPFLYLVFVMGICNIDEKEELFSSMVKAEDVAQVLDMELTDVCNEMREICNGSLDKASIFDWKTCEEAISGKRFLEQIVTDAAYSDGTTIMRYNHSINKYLVGLKNYYTGRIKDLTEEVRDEIRKER